MQPSEEIKQRIDIVDLIREYIPLKAAGVNFKAKCPFHREKTPSFMVSPAKQIWHCFGCGKGGDIFTFIMEMEGLDFVGALKLLAPKAGVELKRVDPKTASQRTRLLELLDLSARYYHHILMQEKAGENAKRYLIERGLTLQTIKDWQIGYSLDSWEGVSRFLRQRGFGEGEIFAAGMTVKKEGRQSFYDRFRGRIMFPIRDSNGRVVAFTARLMPSKEKEENAGGKYIN
ncbi:DNA primase, partial [Candidatus Parcubacteria bacterium]